MVEFSNFSGEILREGDAAYEASRTVFNGTGNPLLIARARSEDDVRLVVNTAHREGLILSIRSGGHALTGLSTNTGGIVLDLSSMNKIQIIDPKQKHVRIESGANWGQVAEALVSHNLIISSGDHPEVGVGGLTLGGGIGWFVRTYGLAIDNLVSARVMLADGKIVEASKDEHSDLFWAIRGGGGNFGVVLSFVFQAHSVPKVIHTRLTFKNQNLAALVQEWAQLMRGADRSLTSVITVMPAFSGRPSVVMSEGVCSDPGGKSHDILERLIHIGEIVSHETRTIPYVEILRPFMSHGAHGTQPFMPKAQVNGFIKDITPETCAAIGEEFEGKGSFFVQLRALGGAIQDVAQSDTAYAHRDAQFLIAITSLNALDPSQEAVQSQLQRMKDHVMPETLGSYMQFMSTYSKTDIDSIYPPKTLERLRKIKQLYDPHNVFNQNHNITPGK